MSFKTILTIFDKSNSISTLKPVIEMTQNADAHLSILVLGLSPRMSIRDFDDYSVSAQWQDKIKIGKQEVQATAKEVGKLLADAAISGDVSPAFSEALFMEHMVTHHALLSDLVFIPKNLSLTPELFSHIISGVLFKSPVAALIGGIDDKPTLNPKNIFIAWSNGLEAARAVHQALPILTQAKEVTIAIFDPVMDEYADGEEPGANVAAWLARHGCKITVQQYPSGGKEIGQCIIKRAEETGADLVVMGAYGHSRMRQRLLGGTTRTMLEQSKLPVFMAH